MPLLITSEGRFEVTNDVHRRWVAAGRPPTRGLSKDNILRRFGGLNPSGTPSAQPLQGVDEAIARRGPNKPLPVNMPAPLNIFDTVGSNVPTASATQTATVPAPSIGFGGEFNPFTGIGEDTQTERTAIGQKTIPKPTVTPLVTTIPKAVSGIHATGGAPIAPVAPVARAGPGISLTGGTTEIPKVASGIHATGGAPIAPVAPIATGGPGKKLQEFAGTNQSVTNGLTPEEFLKKNAPRVHRVGVGGQDIGRGEQLAPHARIIHPSAQAWKNFTDIERETFRGAVESTGLPWNTFLDEARLKNVMGTTPGLRGPMRMGAR